MATKSDRIFGLKEVFIVLVSNIFHVSGHVKQNDLVYMLMWTSSITDPFAWMDTDQDTFISRKCLYQNCFITNDMAYFDDITDFDVILFNAVNLQSDLEIPQKRANNQIYVFVGMQASTNYPVPDTYNGFFNRTWTYKLDSDVYFGHVVVTDNRDKVIGPKKEMHWMDVKNMRPIPKYIKHKLRKKSIAAAWFASNCHTNSKREEFVKRLGDELAHYGHRIDVFGSCGDLECPIDRMEECFALLETDYYFYLAFENAITEDYVTEQIIFALEHYTVPIVYGGANYTRFMPKGIYLDARKLGEIELAKRMHEIIKDKNHYYELFKWHRYYRFHSTEESPETDDFCVFCATMNDLVLRNESSIYQNLAHWWNGQIQVIEPLERISFRERNMRIAANKDVNSKRKISNKKKKILNKEKLAQTTLLNSPNLTSTTSVMHPTTNQEEQTKHNNQTKSTTASPITKSDEKRANDTVGFKQYMQNADGIHSQGNGSIAWMKRDYDFQYDYER